MKKPMVCYVTDRRALANPSGASPIDLLVESIAQAVRAGIDFIHVREKDLDGRPLFELAGKAIAACAAASPPGGSPARILINDRLDVAWAARASGVHLGENSIPVDEAVAWRNRNGRADFLVGRSCHSVESAGQAAAAGADYLCFGPVFATPSKATFGPPQGLWKLKEVCRGVSIPVLAIGGITAENAASCLQAGAAGIAAIRLLQQDPDRVAAALARILA
jgi:thiamine-phosphate pyrophosphorylase